MRWRRRSGPICQHSLRIGGWNVERDSTARSPGIIEVDFDRLRLPFALTTHGFALQASDIFDGDSSRLPSHEALEEWFNHFRREAGRQSRKVRGTDHQHFIGATGRVVFNASGRGGYIFKFFGVSLSALRIGEGLVVAVRAWTLLTQPEVHEDQKASAAGPAQDSQDDVAFFPLTMPLTTGPSSIAVTIALSTQRPASGLRFRPSSVV